MDKQIKKVSKKKKAQKKLHQTIRRSMMEVKTGKDSLKLHVTGQYFDEFKDVVKLYMSVMYEDSSLYESDSFMKYLNDKITGEA